MFKSASYLLDDELQKLLWLLKADSTSKLVKLYRGWVVFYKIEYTKKHNRPKFTLTVLTFENSKR